MIERRPFLPRAFGENADGNGDPSVFGGRGWTPARLVVIRVANDEIQSVASKQEQGVSIFEFGYGGLYHQFHFTNKI